MDIELDKGLSLDEDQLKTALKSIGKEFIREARLLLNTTGQDDIPHTATGTLSRSLRATVRSKKGSIFLRISANTRYATALFTGSNRGTYTVRARPLFDVVMERMKGRINNIIKESLKIDISS